MKVLICFCNQLHKIKNYNQRIDDLAAGVSEKHGDTCLDLNHPYSDDFQFPTWKKVNLSPTLALITSDFVVILRLILISYNFVIIFAITAFAM